MKYLLAVSVSLALFSNMPAQERKPDKDRAVALYFPNNRIVRGELLSMTGLSVSIYVDGKLETYNPALTKLLAVQSRHGWQLFDAGKKKFVAATPAQVEKALGKTALRPRPADNPDSPTSGPVLLANSNKETIRIVTKSYVDAQGRKRILVRTIDVKPGASDAVVDLDGKAIRAAQISFTLITKNGSSEWSAGVREFDGTAIQVVVRGDRVMTATVIHDEMGKRILAEMQRALKYLEDQYLKPWLKQQNRDSVEGGVRNPEFRRTTEGARAYGIYCLIGVLVSQQYADYFRGLQDTDRDVGLIPAAVWKNSALGIRGFLTRNVLEEMFPGQEDATNRNIGRLIAMVADRNRLAAEAYFGDWSDDKVQKAWQKLLAGVDKKLPAVDGLARFCYDFAQANRARREAKPR